MKTKSVLQEAAEISGTSRQRDYGTPFENHRRIADIWNVQLEKKLRAPITPREVALMMVGLKLAREINTPKRDNMVDIVGYVNCIDLIDQTASGKNKRTAAGTLTRRRRHGVPSAT